MSGWRGAGLGGNWRGVRVHGGDHSQYKSNTVKPTTTTVSTVKYCQSYKTTQSEGTTVMAVKYLNSDCRVLQSQLRGGIVQTTRYNSQGQEVRQSGPRVRASTVQSVAVKVVTVEIQAKMQRIRTRIQTVSCSKYCHGHLVSRGESTTRSTEGGITTSTTPSTLARALASTSQGTPSQTVQ